MGTLGVGVLVTVVVDPYRIAHWLIQDEDPAQFVIQDCSGVLVGAGVLVLVGVSVLVGVLVGVFVAELVGVRGAWETVAVREGDGVLRMHNRYSSISSMPPQLVGVTVVVGLLEGDGEREGEGDLDGAGDRCGDGDTYSPPPANCRSSPVRSLWILAMMKNVVVANAISNTSGNSWTKPDSSRLCRDPDLSAGLGITENRRRFL